jgi:hypothetical protein
MKLQQTAGNRHISVKKFQKTNTPNMCPTILLQVSPPSVNGRRCMEPHIELRILRNLRNLQHDGINDPYTDPMHHQRKPHRVKPCRTDMATPQ